VGAGDAGAELVGAATGADVVVARCFGCLADRFLTVGIEVAREGGAAEFRALDVDVDTGESDPEAAQAVNPASKSAAASSFCREDWMFTENEHSPIAIIRLQKALNRDPSWGMRPGMKTF
jgi:hypothetical protein